MVSVGVSSTGQWRVGTYTGEDGQRIVAEAPKSELRTSFERDRARVLHSAALRRLGEKTQVLGPWHDDFSRTRLTHSLEVAQVGRELGKWLGCDADVVDTACLSHDLGHPPFGHNGEEALNQVAKDIGGFEGNAQTLRVLARLEAKSFDSQGRSVGLNLTRASLDATCKYPWARGEGPLKGDKPTKKFGFYQDDRDLYEWMRKGAPEGRKCLEAQVMDLADDISYSVHDVEDALWGGAANLRGLADGSEHGAVIETTMRWYAPSVGENQVAQALERLVKMPQWVHSFEGTRSELAQLKNLTSHLIGRFCTQANRATREVYGRQPLTRYLAQLRVPDETLAEIYALKGIAAHYVMQPREHEADYLRQRTLIFDLAEVLLDEAPRVLDPSFRADWQAAQGEDERLRVVVDQIASLTDVSAHQWHSRLCGMFSS